MLKPKKLVVPALFAVVSGGYFATLSQMDISLFIRGYVAIIPLQILALIYVGYLYLRDRSPNIGSNHSKP